MPANPEGFRDGHDEQEMFMNEKGLWLFQDIIVWADTTEKVMVRMYFKGKPIKHIYACLPGIVF
ncbi:MAG: hypothetical protein IBX72_02230 [Nitrospirae bacterium]|jgi:hypothetical protein|nr:hypothetical protein [Nitrospirota bacterium]